MTYRFDLHMAAAFIFHVQHQADTTATTSTQNDESKLFVGYQRLCNWATCHGLCDLGVIK
jgi:hypothetical protein